MTAVAGCSQLSAALAAARDDGVWQRADDLLALQSPSLPDGHDQYVWLSRAAARM